MVHVKIYAIIGSRALEKDIRNGASDRGIVKEKIILFATLKKLQLSLSPTSVLTK